MKKIFSIITVIIIISCISISAFATNDYTVTSSDTSGLKAILLDLLGDYTPIIVEVTDTDSENNTTTVLEVKNDYVWLASFLMLLAVVYCTFRLGGALLNDI